MLHSSSSEKWYLNQMLTVSGYDTLSHNLNSSAANSGSVSVEPNQRAVLCFNYLEKIIAVCSEKKISPSSLGKEVTLLVAVWSSYMEPQFPTSPREAP